MYAQNGERMNKKVKVGQLADAISKELQEYANQATESAKEAEGKSPEPEHRTLYR